MYKKLEIPILGIIENMSHYVCPSCHHGSDIFGEGGGQRIAAELNIPFLGQIPIYTPIRVGSDTGVPLVISEEDSPATKAFLDASERMAAQVVVAGHETLSAAAPTNVQTS